MQFSSRLITILGAFIAFVQLTRAEELDKVRKTYCGWPLEKRMEFWTCFRETWPKKVLQSYDYCTRWLTPEGRLQLFDHLDAGCQYTTGLEVDERIHKCFREQQKIVDREIKAMAPVSPEEEAMKCFHKVWDDDE